MTVCNMSIEGGARAGLIAPDDATYQYISGRALRTERRGLGRGRRAVAQLADRRRRDLRSRELTIDADTLEPMITFGTNPGMGISISGAVPDPAIDSRSRSRTRDAHQGAALHGSRRRQAAGWDMP